MTKKNDKSTLNQSTRPIVRIVKNIEPEKTSEVQKKVDNNPFLKQMRALADAIDQEVKIILKI